MAQFNINLTPDFERHLAVYMKAKKISTKSEAIRQAFRELADQLKRSRSKTDFRQWRGMGLVVRPNRKPKFKHHDELWD